MDNNPHIHTFFHKAEGGKHGKYQGFPHGFFVGKWERQGNDFFILSYEKKQFLQKNKTEYFLYQKNNEYLKMQYFQGFRENAYFLKK